MNEHDSETIAGLLQEEGCSEARERMDADIVIINTCSVRENADKRFFGTLGQLKKGAKGTVLSRNAPLIYAEATVGGKTYRGYVESKYLDRSQLAGRGTRRQ